MMHEGGGWRRRELSGQCALTSSQPSKFGECSFFQTDNGTSMQQSIISCSLIFFPGLSSNNVQRLADVK